MNPFLGSLVLTLALQLTDSAHAGNRARADQRLEHRNGICPAARRRERPRRGAERRARRRGDAFSLARHGRSAVM